MAAPTYPGVYIQELTSPVHPITGVATSIAAFVGYTARGIDNRAQQIFSFSDYQRLYGGLASNSEVGYSVQQFFLNGGSQAYVVRTPRSGALDASVAFGNNLANSVAVRHETDETYQPSNLKFKGGELASTYTIVEVVGAVPAAAMAAGGS